MNIQDFKACHDVKRIEDLEDVLSVRYRNEENWFLLCFDDEKEPSMTLAVRGDLATLHYLRNNEDAGFVSVGGILHPGEEVIFRMNENSDFPVRGDAVLPFSRALSAAKEFYHSKQLPTSVEWLEL